MVTTMRTRSSAAQCFGFDIHHITAVNAAPSTSDTATDHRIKYRCFRK